MIKDFFKKIPFYIWIAFLFLILFLIYLKYGSAFLVYLKSTFFTILVFSIIVLIHEGGHFWAARFGGIHVEEFGFGLPPKAWGWKNKKSGVLYSINWIPFGGFVKMLGEDDPDNKEASKNPAAFNNRPIFYRIFAVSAGVIMNLLLSIIIYIVIFMIGALPLSSMISQERYNDFVSKYSTESHVFISKIAKDSIADKNNIKENSQILEVNGINIENYNDFFNARQNSDKKLSLVLMDSEGIVYNKEISISKDEKIGIGLAQKGEMRKLDFLESTKETFYEIKFITVASVKQLVALPGKILDEKKIPDDVGGPARIADTIHGVVSDNNFLLLLQLTAFLSLSIGIINIMPIPALDGGRLVFLLFELITRKRVNEKIESIIHGATFILLLLLILAVTWNDIINIFFKS